MLANNEEPQQVSKFETDVAPRSETSNILPVSSLSSVKGIKSKVASETTPNLAQVIEANRPTETQLVVNNKPTEEQLRAQERQETLGLIRRHEGFRSRPYWDVNAWRVGYGQDTINGQRVHRGMNIFEIQQKMLYPIDIMVEKTSSNPSVRVKNFNH